MELQRFELERLQSIWEHRVAWNIAESGVHPLKLDELADQQSDRDTLAEEHLAYPQTNGSRELRAAIAALYDAATPEHVQVTNGGSEANWITLWRLVTPGDELVVMTPNYLQFVGIIRALGATVRPWPLIPVEGGTAERPGWRLDLDALERLLSPRTRAIVICNPNNPTGTRFSAHDVQAICDVARRSGTWVVSDEIYRGAERDNVETATAWGRYERVIVTSGLSKAYGLPGLRIGWVVATPELIEQLWGVHDYTTIAPGALSDRLARMALSPEKRERILARTRGIIVSNYAIVKRWLERREAVLWHAPPDAGAIAFVRYAHHIGSTALVERLRDQHSVLVVPGDHFDMDGHLRIGFGGDPLALTRALELIGEVLDTVSCQQDVSR